MKPALLIETFRTLQHVVPPDCRVIAKPFMPFCLSNDMLSNNSYGVKLIAFSVFIFSIILHAQILKIWINLRRCDGANRWNEEIWLWLGNACWVCNTRSVNGRRQSDNDIRKRLFAVLFAIFQVIFTSIGYHNIAQRAHLHSLPTNKTYALGSPMYWCES